MWFTIQAFTSLFLVAFLAAGSAANPPVGVAKARGDFRVDDATVYRNSTVFEGSTVETATVSAELQLVGGARLLLAPESRSKVYHNRAVLEKGAARFEGTGNYPIEARTLRIVQAGPDSTAQVTIGKTNQVEVSALVGAVQVTNAQGVLVARLMPGTALALNPQEGTPSTRVAGRLQRKDGRFILTDETTNVTVELQGAGLDAQVGNLVEVTGDAIPGATPVAGTTQVIRVSEIRRIVPTPGAPSSVGRGLSTGARVAIVGGVAAGTSVLGLERTGAFEDEKRPVSP